VGINGFSNEGKTFSWRSPRLSSGIKKKSSEGKQQGKKFRENFGRITPCEQLEYFSPEL
jgi:hypothetical protein